MSLSVLMKESFENCLSCHDHLRSLLYYHTEAAFGDIKKVYFPYPPLLLLYKISAKFHTGARSEK